MIKISVSKLIKNNIPNLVLGCIECDVKIIEVNPELWNEIEETCRLIKKKLELIEVNSLLSIKASRNAYKLCGIDPLRYRLSSEALMRRIAKGLDLYHINNVVDLLNLVSLQTGMSIGGYDAEKIIGNVTFDIGTKDEPYEAIGRGDLNIEFLPVFRDRISAFGSPTSDSVRTMATLNTMRFLMVIVGFSGKSDTIEAMDLSVSLLTKYASANQVEMFLIE